LHGLGIGLKVSRAGGQIGDKCRHAQPLDQ
jgi:hypothetical protein